MSDIQAHIVHEDWIKCWAALIKVRTWSGLDLSVSDCQICPLVN